MICPHGHLDETGCPECAMLSNVKPLVAASSAAFTEMEIRRVASTPALNEATHEDASGNPGEIQVDSLGIKRMSLDDKGIITLQGNSTNLHARLKQVLGRGFELGALDENVERLVKEIQKRETNPRAKLD